jgi:hypothetical protein
MILSVPAGIVGAGWQYPPLQTVADMPDGIPMWSGRRCGSQTIIVPSEAGGERPITVTRCRSE